MYCKKEKDKRNCIRAKKKEVKDILVERKIVLIDMKKMK
jgi:hypothetical protein